MAKKLDNRKRTANISINRKPILLSKPLTTLSEALISSSELERIFNVRSLKNIVSKFIELNRENLMFLGIEAEESYSAGKNGVILRTNRFAGAVPIKSPETSLYAVDLEVKGSYSLDLDDDALYSILKEIDAELLPEFHEKLQLVGESVKPPIYLECEHFLSVYEEALRTNWTQFRKEVRVETVPRGLTNWRSHALRSYDPNNINTYENHINSHTQDHLQWRQLNFVLHKAINILQSYKTPSKARKRNAPLIEKLLHNPITQKVESVSHFQIKAIDPPIIKKLKNIANMILTDSSNLRRSWRIDIAKLFEMYVQYVFKKTATGWSIKNSPHFPIDGKHLTWTLSYLEPDIILQKGQNQIVVDAKYKSHMLNRGVKNGGKLKESFRKDIHQVLAYSTFNPMPQKVVFLIYPIYNNQDESADKYCRHYIQNITTPFSNTSVAIHLLGIPFGKGVTKPVINELRTILNSIEKEDQR